MPSELNPPLISLAAAVLLAPAVSLLPHAAKAEIQGPVCRGTLLQLNLRESGESRTDRFRFNLRLEAEASTSAAALEQLSARQSRLRDQLEPLVVGRLVIPAPNTFAMAGSQPSKGYRASTTITGTVGRSNYEPLIQRAGRLPGVRLQGMTSLPSAEGQDRIQDQLLERALERGRRQAERTAAALRLRRVALLRIDQRSHASVRPAAMAVSAAPRFRPEEAPLPTASLTLALDYCLS
ncbi:SIMPL domain-containing protein [Synechococcus sp. UW179A]|uniref:SIMPL domain-containing protein n=1 Tax=Synechococcus sp. UW179A TaxID=2575510 RepID=UPI000E0E2770|nr:SIMPL domain-containing protein [Synechococcus sp. UW179A]